MQTASLLLGRLCRGLHSSSWQATVSLLYIIGVRRCQGGGAFARIRLNAPHSGKRPPFSLVKSSAKRPGGVNPGSYGIQIRQVGGGGEKEICFNPTRTFLVLCLHSTHQMKGWGGRSKISKKKTVFARLGDVSQCLFPPGYAPEHYSCIQKLNKRLFRNSIPVETILYNFGLSESGSWWNVKRFLTKTLFFPCNLC